MSHRRAYTGALVGLVLVSALSSCSTPRASSCARYITPPVQEAEDAAASDRDQAEADARELRTKFKESPDALTEAKTKYDAVARANNALLAVLALAVRQGTEPSKDTLEARRSQATAAMEAFSQYASAKLRPTAISITPDLVVQVIKGGILLYQGVRDADTAAREACASGMETHLRWREWDTL